MSWKDEDEFRRGRETYDAYAQALGRVEMWAPWARLTAEEQRAWVEAAKAARRAGPPVRSREDHPGA